MAVWTLSTRMHRASLQCTPRGWNLWEKKQDWKGGGGQGRDGERKNTKQASVQKTRTTRLLGPVRAWTSSKLEVLGRSTFMAGMVGTWLWSSGDLGASCTIRLPTRRLINLRFFHCFWELISFEWTGLHWLSEIVERQDNQEGKGRGIRRIQKRYVAEEVNAVSIC